MQNVSQEKLAHYVKEDGYEKVTIHADGFKGFKNAHLERTKKLDRGEFLEPEKNHHSGKRRPFANTVKA